jgi:hypothetical protein
LEKNDYGRGLGAAGAFFIFAAPGPPSMDSIRPVALGCEAVERSQDVKLCHRLVKQSTKFSDLDEQLGVLGVESRSRKDQFRP